MTGSDFSHMTRSFCFWYCEDLFVFPKIKNKKKLTASNYKLTMKFIVLFLLIVVLFVLFVFLNIKSVKIKKNVSFIDGENR